MDNLVPIIIVATLTYGIYSLFELFVRRKERMTIIDKLSSNVNPSTLPEYNLSLPRISVSKSDNVNWPIRIGCLLIGIGLGITCATIVDLTTAQHFAELSNNNGHAYSFRNNAIDVLYLACACLFGGIGLVMAYIIEHKIKKADKTSA